MLDAMTFASAHASGGCKLILNSATSGFVLSPTIDKLTVVEATSTEPDRPCQFMANDELLQINDQVVPGRKAKEVMRYWKALPKDAPFTFKVKRNDSTISVVID